MPDNLLDEFRCRATMVDYDGRTRRCDLELGHRCDHLVVFTASIAWPREDEDA